MSNTLPLPTQARIVPQFYEWHPWLTSLALISFILQRNTESLQLASLVIVYGLALAAASGLYLLTWVSRRSSAQAALMATVTISGLATYGYVFRALSTAGSISHPWISHALLVASGIALVLTIWRTRGSLRPLAMWLSLTMAILLVQSTTKLAAWGVRMVTVPSHVVSDPVPLQTKTTPAPSAGLPDIYYIILDGYARADVLRRNYDFDNSPFLDGLRERGFYIAEKSCANYPVTILSLSSSMNIRFHGSIPSPFHHHAFFEMVRSPQVAKVLQQHGYRYVHYNNTWPGAAFSRVADATLGEDRGIRDIALRIQEPSVFKFVTRHDLRSEHIAVMQSGLSSLREMGRSQQPTFTFAHFIAPHPPYVLDRDGQFHTDINQTGRKPYVDEIVALNHEMLQIVDRIRQRSEIPPVIVIQSDHGPGFVADELGNDPEWVQERLPILNTYLVPECVRQKLYPTITPVNTFRILLSECLGVDLPPLPDRVFITHYRNLSVVKEVTDRIKDGRPDAMILLPKAE